MKCCKCEAEIPDGSKFCMECGAEQFKGKSCQKCGMTGLPEEALFCPNCGKQFNTTPISKTSERTGNIVEHEKHNMLPPAGDSISWFFPLYGITIGKTTMAEAKAMGYEPESNGVVGLASSFFNKHISSSAYIGEWTVRKNGAYFNKPSGKDFIDSLSISTFLYGKFPEEWEKKYNVSLSSSYNEWKGFMERMGFSIFIPIAPPTNISSSPSGKLPLAVLICTSSDKKLEVRLHFGIGNKNIEGSITDAANYLSMISMKCLTT